MKTVIAIIAVSVWSIIAIVAFFVPRSTDQSTAIIRVKPATISRGEFESKASMLTADQVRKAFGSPDIIHRGVGHRDYGDVWQYAKKTYASDPKTPDDFAVVCFRPNGTIRNIGFLKGE